jgi:hypothetical protein
MWIEHVGTQIHRLWTVRLSIFFGVLNGAALGLAAFVDVFNPWLFMGLNVVVYGVIAVVRLIKQTPPEVPGEESGE